MMLMKLLAEKWPVQPTAASGPPLRVVVSGAGPIGLRAAVECALHGSEVTVVEKRNIFSRVNILLLWACTAEDLIGCGAKTFIPGFSSKHDILHLGTRGMQLVLLKSALLLGVRLEHSTELIAVRAPDAAAGAGWDGMGWSADAPPWSAWTRAAASTDTSQTSAGVLDFKPDKRGQYERGAGQGRCNLLQESLLDPNFCLRAESETPEGVTSRPFEALVLAEGEWSTTCSKLGVTKSIDRFAQAIGLVVNM